MIPTSIEFIKLDLSEKKIESKLPNKVQKIVHLAGQSSGEISFDNPVIDLKKYSFNIKPFELRSQSKYRQVCLCKFYVCIWRYS